MKTNAKTTNAETPNELVVRWLVEMDTYLWANALNTTAAAKLAAEDGLAVQPRRLGRLAGVQARAGHRPGSRPLRMVRIERTPRIGKCHLLNGDEWQKLLTWVKDHAQYFLSLGSVSGVCRLAKYHGHPLFALDDDRGDVAAEDSTAAGTPPARCGRGRAQPLPGGGGRWRDDVHPTRIRNAPGDGRVQQPVVVGGRARRRPATGLRDRDHGPDL